MRGGLIFLTHPVLFPLPNYEWINRNSSRLSRLRARNRSIHIPYHRHLSPARDKGRILLRHMVPMVVHGIRLYMHHSLDNSERHPLVNTPRRDRILFILVNQGNFRATRTRAERLVSDESETETRIRIETILSGQTLCNPIKGFLFLLQEAL